METWSAQNAERLPGLLDTLVLPPWLSDRQEDICEPLLAIAAAAGSDWPPDTRAALAEVLLNAAPPTDSLRVRLLADIRSIFHANGSEALPSVALCAELARLDGPWAEWHRGDPISASQLARQLEHHSIAPRTIRLGDKTPKGYRRTDFEDAWSRYLPSVAAPVSENSPIPPLQTATPPQPACLLGETAFSSRNSPKMVTAQNDRKLLKTKACCGVAAPEGGIDPPDVILAALPPPDGKPMSAGVVAIHPAVLPLQLGMGGVKQRLKALAAAGLAWHGNTGYRRLA